MAVSIPSDLVLDVMRNADPARLAASRSRLTSQIADSSAAEFSRTLESRATDSPLGTVWKSQSPTDVNRKAGEPGADAYAGFERMVLRNLFEAMLPAEDSGLTPKDPGSDIWRSMAADQYAGVAADSGGIGIARMLAERGTARGPQTEAQWPYFSVSGIAGFES